MKSSDYRSANINSIDPVNCLSSTKDSILTRALNEICKLCSNGKDSELISECDAVIRIRWILEKHLSAPKPTDSALEIVAQASKALLSLLCSEVGIRDFLISDDAFDKKTGKRLLIDGPRHASDGNALKLVSKLITFPGEDDSEIQLLGIQILERLMSKQTVGGGNVAHQQPFDASPSTVIIGESLNISQECRPTFFNVNNGETKKDKEKESTPDKRTNQNQFALSFWILVESMGDKDGLPLFRKGKPNTHLMNRSSEKKVQCVHISKTLLDFKYICDRIFSHSKWMRSRNKDECSSKWNTQQCILMGFSLAGRHLSRFNRRINLKKISTHTQSTCPRTELR